MMYESLSEFSGSNWDQLIDRLSIKCGTNLESSEGIFKLFQQSNTVPGSGTETADILGKIENSILLNSGEILVFEDPFQPTNDAQRSRVSNFSAVDPLTGLVANQENLENFSSSSTVGMAEKVAYNLLEKFAKKANFTSTLSEAFGEKWNSEIAANLFQEFAQGNFTTLPGVEILPAAGIKGANGAFASVTNMIYLSQEFVETNASNLDAIANVLLEEIGHYIDAQINSSDAPGDEGAIFSALLQEKPLTANELSVLKAEDDSAVLTLNGQVFWIEQSANKKADFNGDGKTDFIRQEKGFWDDDNLNTANVFLSNGNGTFWKQNLTTNPDEMKGDHGVNIILGDFNGDKKTDFIRQEKGFWDDDNLNTANVFLSNGNGTFWKQNLTTNPDEMKGDVTNLIVGDFNGDGKDDFIRQEKGFWDDDSFNTANVFLSNGNGTFWKQNLTTNPDEMKGDVTNLIVGDFNGDGKDDFIRQEKGFWDDDSFNTANVFLSNGNGTFWKQNLTTNPDEMKGDVTNLIVGDFNGDKKTDFIRQEKGFWDDDNLNTANVFLSNGNGTFGKQSLTTNPDEMKGDFSNIITTSPKLYEAGLNATFTQPLPSNPTSADPFFKLQYKHWKYNSDGPFSSTNCGPASLAMVIKALGREPANISTETSIDHARYLMSGYSNGSRQGVLVLDNDKAWTTFDQVKKGIQNAGGIPESLTGWDALDRSLNAGRPVISFGNLTYTWRQQFPNRVGSGSGGHWNAILGKTSDGKYIVADPMHEGGPVAMTKNQLAVFTYYGYPEFVAFTRK